MTLSSEEQSVHFVLNELKISFVRFEHPPVFTVEQAEIQWADIPGIHCKNLFLRNKKGNRHYLVILPGHKQADLKQLTRCLGADRLSFASAERLRRYLGLKPGSVSPFGLINDSERMVTVVIDREFREAEAVSFHPNINTATLSLTFRDFEKFLDSRGNRIVYQDF